MTSITTNVKHRVRTTGLEHQGQNSISDPDLNLGFTCIFFKKHYGLCTERLLTEPYERTPAAVSTNNNKEMRSFKSSENFQKKECGPDGSVSNNEIPSMTNTELGIKTRG